jgi:hypothetical protein
MSQDYEWDGEFGDIEADSQSYLRSDRAIARDRAYCEARDARNMFSPKCVIVGCDKHIGNNPGPLCTWHQIDQNMRAQWAR